ncbi:class I SAM-dependent methyltransferase [Streptomyces sp. RerS4]|uniref:class I SAM-dependent methyltransferase n=1 Tax=Streptomyces sp. RerS4 TaxID=2942449 RepID=UPI00201CAC64|nr:class I SAM-dependent methyltransferase [Streptomyces sp. RerS4]UQW99914.1 methyltransferase [Streptomyces sp. RerS4]
MNAHEHDASAGRHEHRHRHTHGHGHGDTDVDWAALADHLESNAEVHLPAHLQVADRLRTLLGPDRPVRRVLDIGSGPGVMACVFAEAFPDAEVLAVDGTPELLERTLTRADRLGLAGRVAVHHTLLPEDLNGATGIASDLGTADLVWSSKAVHHLGDQQGALDALVGVLRPGGMLAVAEGGLPMRFLPRDIGLGRPGLQARLDAAQEGWFQDMREGLPGSAPVVEDWPAMLGRAGLTDVRSFTALLDLPAPLDDAGRAFLHAQLSRLREKMDEALDAADVETLDVLVDPASEQGILRRPDAFLLSAVTVFTGVRASS